MESVLILGGYGNFGKRIAHMLAVKGIPVIIAGRDRQKAEVLANELPGAQAVAFDVNQELDAQLEALKPLIVINTCGPFQTSDYRIAETCIEKGVHYIDLADGRAFVTGITVLEARAKEKGVTVISGASTVPGLSSAVLEHYKNEFSEIESLRFGISPGQRVERGLATTKAIMTYVGKKLKPFPSAHRTVYGWQNLYRQEYPELGKRWMANCDVPDLDLLPQRYGIKNIQFSAGMENTFVHLGIWLFSWAVRLGLPLNLPHHAGALLRASHWFDAFGTADGGMHMIMRGKDRQGKPHERKWFLIAKDGHGPNIPCIAAVILTKKLVSGQKLENGAMPCLGLFTLEEFMAELEGLSIHQVVL